MLFVMLPKVDYVLITSLFVYTMSQEDMYACTLMSVWRMYIIKQTSEMKCIKMITMLGIFLSLGEPYEVMICNGTVWQRMVLFYCSHERRNVYGTN